MYICLYIWANVYLLARLFGVKPRANYSRRRYRENIYRPLRRENKRFFWEPASYDDLSARFNGVPFNVAVTTLDVNPRSYPRLCTRIPSNSLFSVCSYTRTNLWSSPFFSTRRTDSASVALERDIDFLCESSDPIKLLHRRVVQPF